MAEYSVNADKKRGKRLEKSLEKLLPNKSWRARSQLLEIPDSTVIGWRNGREISCSGLSRLFTVGCDIVYILTGKDDPEHTVTHSLRFMQPEDFEKEREELRGENIALKQQLYALTEASEEQDEHNSNRKQPNVLIDKEVTKSITYDEKGEMTDSAGVDFLKDHLATIKQDKADLQAKVAILEKELTDLREENKRLLTLSSAKATTQAGSA